MTAGTVEAPHEAPPTPWPLPPSVASGLPAKLHACANCKRSKVSCSRLFDQSPCHRCVRLGLTCGDTKEIKLACASCRRSKVKCDMTAQTPCSRCTRLGMTCVVGSAARRPAVEVCPLSLLSAAATQPPLRPAKKPRTEPTEAPLPPPPQPPLAFSQHLASSASSLVMLAMFSERAEAAAASQPPSAPEATAVAVAHLQPAEPANSSKWGGVESSALITSAQDLKDRIDSLAAQVAKQVKAEAHGDAWVPSAVDSLAGCKRMYDATLKPNTCIR